MAITAVDSKFRHLDHGEIFRDSELVHGFKKLRASAREAQKMHFVPRGEYSRMRTINFILIMQIGSRVVQIIIVHKSFHIIYIKMRAKNKVALAVELRIYICM